MEFVLKAFRIAICSLVIYGCFEGNVAQIRAEKTALNEKTNNGGGEENSAVITNDEFRKESNPDQKTVTKRDVKSEESYPVDDEDAEKETDSPGSGDETAYMQSDEPSAPLGGNNESLSMHTSSDMNSGKRFSVTSTRALEQTIIRNATTASPSKVKINISPTTRTDGNSSDTVANNPLYSTPYLSGGSETVDTTSVKSSVHPLPALSIASSKMRASEPSSAIASRSTGINPTGITTNQPKTIETTTNDDSDVQNRKDPPPDESERRKTLFGFVTVEILVALLAGAACAVILLIFLVYRLKKRNEGSYELQESMSLKAAAYAEEKEVFV